MRVLASWSSLRVIAANPSDSVRTPPDENQVPKSGVSARSCSRTRTALSTACWRATSERCSSSEERAKA